MKMVLGTLWSYILQDLPYIIVFFPLYIAARAVWLKACAVLAGDRPFGLVSVYDFCADSNRAAGSQHAARTEALLSGRELWGIMQPPGTLFPAIF